MNDLKERIKILAEKYFPRVVEIRRDLHANPELSWNEKRTSQLVAEELRKCGFEVTTNVAQTGVVALLKGTNPSTKCIALRADMDALPINEINEVSYKSCNEGVMHACGHDVHTANLLGGAMILAELKDEIEGSVKFIFQPSEEKTPSGAEAMIKEGVLNNPTVSKIFGLHVSPEIEAGKFGFHEGRFMASSDEIYITIIGKGGHAAQRDLLINPLIVASQLLLQLDALNAGAKNFVLSFGSISGAGATNIVPDKVEIAGTLRCFDEEFRNSIKKRIQEICKSVAEAHKANCELNIVMGSPVVINNEGLTGKAASLSADYLGEANVLAVPRRMGSEDFGYYTQHIPACFYRLGVGNKTKGISSGLHTPTFDIDENALKDSIGLMSWLAIKA
ncbi:MAG: M20 family metallopeptidase [Chitinophagales bacterium]